MNERLPEVGADAEEANAELVEFFPDENPTSNNS